MFLTYVNLVMKYVKMSVWLEETLLGANNENNKAFVLVFIRRILFIAYITVILRRECRSSFGFSQKDIEYRGKHMHIEIEIINFKMLKDCYRCAVLECILDFEKS